MLLSLFQEIVFLWCPDLPQDWNLFIIPANLITNPEVNYLTHDNNEKTRFLKVAILVSFRKKMASQEIVNYIREGKRRGFTVGRLKEELIKHGFDEKIVDDAVNIVEGIQRVSLNNNYQQVQNNVKPADPYEMSIIPKERKVQQDEKTDSNYSRFPVSEKEKKSHVGLIIFLSILFLLLIGAGVASWIYRDIIIGWFG